jgi:hypothetical protein
LQQVDITIFIDFITIYFAAMKRIIISIAVFFCISSAFSQNVFPSVDSAKNYVLRYIRNSTVESFTNLRMQRAVFGTLELLDSITSASSGGGVDSIWRSQSATKDTLKYSISGTTYTICTLDRVDLKVAISDTASMLTGYTRVQRFLDSLTAIRSAIGSGGGSGLADDSTNTFGKNVNLYAAVLKVTRSGSANTWSILDDADHEPLGVTSISADASKITVNYSAGTEVMTMLAVQDETMSISAASNSGTPYYTYGPYNIGARCFASYAEFTISRTTQASFIVYYNGSAWVVGSGTIRGSYDAGSPAWTVSWTTGRLRISGVSAGFRKVPSGNMVAWGGSASNLKYVPGFNIISDTFIDIYFYDITTGAQYTDATPPTNFAIYLDFGSYQTIVNPTTEDFGATGSTNFWMFGVMKK